MSILTDLRSALEAKQEAWAAFTAYTHGADQQALLDEYDIACGRYEALLTDDTVAALIAVVDEVTRREPILVADPENDRLLNLAAALTRAPLVKETDDE